MNTITAKKFSAILNMAAFSRTAISVSVSDSENAGFRFDTTVSDFTNDAIFINQPADISPPDLQKILYRQIIVRLPYAEGVCEWTAEVTDMVSREDNASFVCGNPGECIYINHRRHQRIELSALQKSYQAEIRETSGRNHTITCETVFDISKIAAAVTMTASDTTFLTEGTEATFVLRHADKTVFQAPVTRTVFHRSQGTPDVTRQIVFFKPARRKGIYKRRIRRITPPEVLPVFIKLCHPLIPDETLKCRMEDFSKTGFSFSVEGHSVSLFPGLVLDEIRIFFPFSKPFTASATVVHCTQVSATGENRILIGLAVHHISEQLTSVSDFLYLQDIDESLTDASPSDFEDIFCHLFSSNFIYAQKRRFLQYNASAVQSTQYHLLKPNTISKTVVSKFNAAIRGSIQYIKFHKHTWLVQHLAGGSGSVFETGKLAVKATIDFFLYPEINRIRKIRYVTCYYRPQNPFPMLLFNGFAQHIAAPSISQSIGYTYCTLAPYAKGIATSNEYHCTSASASDLAHLESLIIKQHGSIYKRVEALSVKDLTSDSLSREYRRYGLLRKRRVLCLKKQDGTPLAFSVCEISSPGMNLSELTNSFKIYYSADNQPYMKEALNVLAAATVEEYNRYDISCPVFLSPPKAMIPTLFTEIKQYMFWFLDAAYFNELDSYFDTVTGNFKLYLRRFKESMNIRNENAGHHTTV